MTQAEKRLFLIQELLQEKAQYQGMGIPHGEQEQRQLLRSLLNIRTAAPVSEAFLRVQDEYLQTEIAAKGITSLSDLVPIQKEIYLWQGDITTLQCDTIVNAANSGMRILSADIRICIFCS